MGVKRKVQASNDSGVSFEEVFDEFIAEKIARNCSKDTIRSYNGSYKRFSEFIGDRNGASEITQETIYAFIYSLQEEEVKPTSINHYLRDIRAIIRFGQEQGTIAQFPIKLIKEQEYIKETYSEEEMLLLLAKPKPKESFVEWRTWAIVNWVYGTGNRAETVCSIQIKDISFTRNEITLRHTKNKKALQIPLSRSLSLCIKEYMKKWRSRVSDDAYLFPNIGEEKLTTNALRLSLARYNKSRGVSKTSIHSLRHTFAKEWIRNTGEVFRLQKILGNSTLEMTRRYVNMFGEDLKENFDSYNPLDRLKKAQVRTQRVARNDD